MKTVSKINKQRNQALSDYFNFIIAPKHIAFSKINTVFQSVVDQVEDPDADGIRQKDEEFSAPRYHQDPDADGIRQEEEEFSAQRCDQLLT